MDFPSTRSTPRHRTACPLGDDAVRNVLGNAFQRGGRETRLATSLAQGDPAYDPELARMAVIDGEDAGWALFLPRRFRLRGTDVPLAVAAPIGVEPRFRRRGVGRSLLEEGGRALVERGIRGDVSMGAPEFFADSGFGSAFDMHAVQMPADYLPEEGDTTPWHALSEEDLPDLVRLAEASYREINGSEVRRAAALDWESLSDRSYAMVHGEPGAATAYLRFRLREKLEITECGAAGAPGVDAILRMMRRLAREHAVAQYHALLAPCHPVARALQHRGGMAERCNFGGAAVLRVLDWKGLLEDLEGWWRPAMERWSIDRMSLEVRGESWLLERGPTAGQVMPGAATGAHLWIPTGWEGSLLTGQRTALDLEFEPTVAVNSRFEADGFTPLLRDLFSTVDAQWTYSAAYELADD